MSIPNKATLGTIWMTTVSTEFGGTTPHNLSEYYAGGSLVGAGTTGEFGAVPASGAIGLRNFYGTSARAIINIVIAASEYNVNIRTKALATGWNGTTVATVNVTVNAGVYVGQTYTLSGSAGYERRAVNASAAMVATGFPAGSNMVLTNNGYILGSGGIGGSYLTPNDGGVRGGSWGGGDALYVNLATTVYNYGTIGGGGGGGAGGDGAGSNSLSGGGGAGYQPGLGGYGWGCTNRAASGTTWAGGLGSYAPCGEPYSNRGGAIGAAGTYSGNFNSTGQVGQPGAYIVGGGYVTWAVAGDRRGVAA